MTKDTVLLVEKVCVYLVSEFTLTIREFRKNTRASSMYSSTAVLRGVLKNKEDHSW